MSMSPKFTPDTGTVLAIQSALEVEEFYEKVVAVKATVENLPMISAWLKAYGLELAWTDPAGHEIAIWKGGYCERIRVGDRVVRDHGGFKVLPTGKFAKRFIPARKFVAETNAAGHTRLAAKSPQARNAALVEELTAFDEHFGQEA